MSWKFSSILSDKSVRGFRLKWRKGRPVERVASPRSHSTYLASSSRRCSRPSATRSFFALFQRSLSGYLCDNFFPLISPPLISSPAFFLDGLRALSFPFPMSHKLVDVSCKDAVRVRSTRRNDNPAREALSITAKDRSRSHVPAGSLQFLPLIFLPVLPGGLVITCSRESA